MYVRLKHKTGRAAEHVSKSIKDSFIQRKVVPGKRVNFSQRLYEKIFDPFARVKSRPQKLWSSRLKRIDPAGRGNVFIWGKVGLARKVSLPSKEGDPAGRVTLLAEQTFCLRCKRFCKEM